MIPSWLGIALYLTLLIGMLTLLRLIRRRTQVHPEVVRKLLHIGMGLGTLAFPWVFHALWPVLVLLLLSWLLLLGMRHNAWLRACFGGILDSVARPSLGEFYFPLSIAIVFLLSHGSTLLFIIPILLLTLADSSAALIGMRLGRRHYPAGNGKKSLEGSLACFLSAALCTAAPLYLFFDAGRTNSLLLGMNLGLLVMLLEALAWGGLDNILIPVGSCLLLQFLRERNTSELGFILAVLVTFVVLLTRRVSRQFRIQGV